MNEPSMFLVYVGVGSIPTTLILNDHINSAITLGPAVICKFPWV